MPIRPPALLDIVPGNLGLEVGMPRSSIISRGSSVYAEIPDCDTSLYTDGPTGVIFPQTPGMWGCVSPVAGIPHPSYMWRADTFAGGAAGTLTYELANNPPKSMVVSAAAVLPTWQQSIPGWAKRAVRFSESAGQGLHIPFAADGSWWDVGRQDVAILIWAALSSTGGNRPFFSLAGTSVQLRYRSVGGAVEVLTAGGSGIGTYDYRHAGVLTVHPILISLKHGTTELRLWTDKEAISGVWQWVSDLEKGPRVTGQSPPNWYCLGFDVWAGFDKAGQIHALNKALFTRLGFAVAY